MSTQVQYRRGTQAENDAFTGAIAEITVDSGLAVYTYLLPAQEK